MISRVWAIAWTGFMQLLRSRVYLNILVAGIALVVAALVFDELSAGEGGRVLFDLGLAFGSLVSAILAGTLAITTLTRELETKQAHLIVARPIARGELVVGRFVTVALLVLLANVTFGALLAILLRAIASPGGGEVFFASVFVSFEGFIVAAIALFFGVGSSSTMSAVFVSTFFVLGRLTGELHQLIEMHKLPTAEPILKIVYVLLPHLSALDLTSLRESSANTGAIAGAVVYSLAYAGAFLAFAIVRINRRDLL